MSIATLDHPTDTMLDLSEGRMAFDLKTKLNIGSGPHYFDHFDWLNMDIDPQFPADVYASIFDMPFPDGRFSWIYMGHLLEHLAWDDIPKALQEVRRVSKSGAKIGVVGPCLHKALDLELPIWLLKQIARTPNGNPSQVELTGNGHAWHPDTELTLEALRRGGMMNVREVPAGSMRRPEWPNTVPDAWQVFARANVP